MLVAELLEWLSHQDPRSPVCIMGISGSGDPVREPDIVLGTGQGPTDDVDEVILSWTPAAEAEIRYELRHRA
ncbi:hypothetical protein [Actinoplanes sp. URMC 104]|uniref:hypothetical protein n=1 Tax=Actinoplanes sp. URMC 104 TaxID=3423409 RepID=UPI003F19958F